MKKIYLTLLLMLGSLMLSAQVVTTQPKIAVVPYIKEGQNYRTLYEDDANIRIVMTKIREAFDAKNFTTVDFVAKLQAQSQASEVYGEGTKRDLKSQILQLTGADMYVVAEIITNFASSGNSVRIIMTAYDIATGNSLANKVADSGELYTNDVGGLATRALARTSGEFLEVLQNKFNKMVLEGRSISVDFTLDEETELTFSTEVETGNTIADEIELWVAENAYQNNYHTTGTSDLYMNFDDIRIPIRDENGNNYKPLMFRMALTKFLKSIKLNSKIDINGYAFHVKITGQM
ncbi:MAG: hypothetical protein IKP73_04880 [Bacteroidales bacterium]|nr:hypothetical protein [Bacteroidales bacterium]